MKKVILGIGILVLVMVTITLTLYLVSREPKSMEEVVGGPNPTEEYQKYINDTSIKKIYLGILPCADCEGEETVIVLTQESEAISGGTYQITRSFLGTDLPTEEEAGNWTTQENAENSDLSIFVLTSGSGIEQSYEQIDENTIIMLDENGARMEVDSQNYTLVLQ